MVTFITILQVNLVMSVLLYVMFLAYLCGIQATSMDRHKPTPDPVNSLIIKLLQADIVRSRQRQEEVPDDGVASARDPSQATVSKGVDYLQRTPSANLEIDAGLLEQHRRYNSPRVLLSERPPMQPPPMYLADDYVGGTDAVNRTRRRRYAEHKSYRGEYSVCDSESQWVTNKSSAVDIRGRLVTLLEDIKTSGSNVKQYFYETKCRSAKPFKGGCRGIDEKHWNSQCKTQQTYVRALAVERVSIVNWRWIRIDTACVCALSRKKRRT